MGSKKALRDGIQIQVNDRLEIDCMLELGASERTVTVSSEAPALE